jgi:hypothetical protein
MIEIISVGDKIISGRYQIHSRFSRAVNFQCGDSLASLVNEEVGAGPVNLVTRGIDFNTVQSIQIDNERLLIDSNEFRCEDLNRYKSELVFPDGADPNILFLNLQTFKEALIAYSLPKSLTLLIEPGSTFEFWGNREKYLYLRFNGALKFMKQGELKKGVCAIRGLGIGLTPSGDDFIAGMMAAYRAAEQLFYRDYSDLINEIYTNAIGGNLISNSFLLCARDGCFTEIQKNLMIALACGSDEEVNSFTRELCGIGATSGADWGVGVYKTFNSI